MTSQNDTVLEKILYELEIITKIEKGKKISTVDSECINIIEPSMASGVYRYVHGDSRERLMPLIENRVNLANNMCEKILESRYLALYDDPNRPNPFEEETRMYNQRLLQVHRLYEALSNLPVGLGTLSETYSGDNFMVFRLNNLATTLTKRMVVNISNSLKKIKENKIRWQVTNGIVSGNTPPVRTFHISTPIPIPSPVGSFPSPSPEKIMMGCPDQLPRLAIATSPEAIPPSNDTSTEKKDDVSDDSSTEY